MGGESPNVILYDVNGQEMSVSNGSAIPSGTSALMIAGSDGTNSRFITIDTSGRFVMVGPGTAGTPAGGVLSIQGVPGGQAVPISGSITITGTAAVTQSTSPWVDNITQFGGTNISTGTGASGTGIPRVTVSNDSNILATQSGTWTVQQGTPPWTVSQATASNLNATVVGLGTAGSPSGGIVSTQVPDITNLSALNALNAASAITLAGTHGAGMQLAAGTLQGTIVPEISYDGGTTWVASFFVDQTTSNVVSSIVFGSNNTATARTIVVPEGASSVRVRVSVFTSGTANCTVRSSSIVEPHSLFAGAPAAASPPSAIQIAGNDGSNLRAILTDASGHPIIVGDGVAGTPAGGVVSIQGVSGGTTVPISGTVAVTQSTSPWVVSASGNFNNASVSATAAAVPASATFVGGEVQALQSGLTSGDLYPLSMTTAGLLRVDGSNVTQPVSGTVTANQGTANTLANAWSTKITDATNGPVAVKAASTAAAAADPSLVVGLSPNSPLPTGANNIGSVNNVQTAESTAAWTSSTSNNTTLALTVTGYGTVTVTLNQGTTITGGAVTFEGSDTVAGTNWYPISMVSTAGATVPVSTYTLVASTNVAFQTNVAGFIQFRVRLSPAITGTGTVNVGITANASAAEWQQAAFLTDGTHGPVAVKTSSTAAVTGDQALVVTISPNSAPLQVTNSVAASTPGIAQGYISTSATTNVAVQATTYTEQSANFTGSVASSSASDASAGTGARTITIYYVDATGVTAGTETATLNGTTGVNLVTTTKCFIEKIIVNTVGSGGSNAGIISLYTGASKGGTVVATIAIGDNQTYLGHHYVVSGKTCNIFGMTGFNNNTGNQTVFTLRSAVLPVANQANVQVSDWITGYELFQPFRIYDQLIKVAGPAVVQIYGAPGGTPTIKNYGAFDYYDA